MLQGEQRQQFGGLHRVDAQSLLVSRNTSLSKSSQEEMKFVTLTTRCPTILDAQQKIPDL
jgi:hypothetical protein